MERCRELREKAAGLVSDHNFSQLRAFILRNSVSQDWATARLEWTLDSVEDLGEATDQCPCSYEPIRHRCWLFNLKTKALVYVGNVCVNRFLPEHDLNTVIAGLKRIQSDGTKAANEALLKWARTARVITQWEYNFGMSTWRKRRLSARQSNKRLEINRRITARLVATRHDADGGVATC